MYGYYKPTYAAQEMLGTYASGQTVGNPLARRNEADPYAALAEGIAAITGTVIGVASGANQAKKNRLHEAEMAEYNMQAQGLAAKAAALQSQAAAAVAGLDAKKAATYAAYGMGTVVLLGAMGFTGVLILKKRRG